MSIFNFDIENRVRILGASSVGNLSFGHDLDPAQQFLPTNFILFPLLIVKRALFALQSGQHFDVLLSQFSVILSYFALKLGHLRFSAVNRLILIINRIKFGLIFLSMIYLPHFFQQNPVVSLNKLRIFLFRKLLFPIYFHVFEINAMRRFHAFSRLRLRIQQPIKHLDIGLLHTMPIPVTMVNQQILPMKHFY